eukprot:Em0394g3a
MFYHGCIDRVSYLHHMNGHRSPASTNQGVECSMPAAHLKPKRQPITNEMLGQMLSELVRDHKPSHDRFMLKAAIILGFFGLLRVSEFIVPNRCGFNPDQLLTTKDITMRKAECLRIGAATAVSRSGLPPATIKNLGRWRSEAYKVYMRHLLTQLAP